MVAYRFERILKKGAVEAPDREISSRTWYRDIARRTTANPDILIRSDRSRFRIKPEMGNMYIFNYSPKSKETIPYYDRFPLVIPIDTSRKVGKMIGTDFLGINLHYLPLKIRARLFDALYTTVDLDDPERTFRINYQILKNAHKYRFFRPCIKKYILNHVKSRFFEITPDEWDIALFLPLERFVKATKARVHRESIARI